MCLVHWCCFVPSLVNDKATWLSQYIIEEENCGNDNKEQRVRKYIISFPASASAINSASQDDNDTVDCLHDLHDIGALPSVMIWPDVNLLSLGSFAQSESV